MSVAIANDVNVAVAVDPRIVHALPGRVRVHIPEWKGQEKRRVETHLREIAGVQRVLVNTLTGNILLYFDVAVTNEQDILAAMQVLDIDMSAEAAQEALPPPAISERRGEIRRARIAVRGLDRDPGQGQRIVEHLQGKPGVQRASVSLLTGRVLVEFTEQEVVLEELVAAVADLEPPPLPGEDHPAHPLDLDPLIQSAVRLGGSALGLGLLAVRRLAGQGVPAAGAALPAAVIIGLLQGVPFFRFGLRKLFGRTAADLLLSLPSIVILTFANSPLGLALGGIEALRLLTEVYARRTAWRQYEERVEHTATLHPGAVIHLEAGERTPLPAEIIEGTGCAIGKDSLPVPVFPGALVSSGALLYGGPFSLQLSSEEIFQSFVTEPPKPMQPLFYQRYMQTVGPFSLIYIAAMALLTRSFSQTLTAMLLMSPRSATVGVDGADLSASARVLRAGVTVVSTRPNRTIRLPNVVLLDGIRPLSDGLELNSVHPLVEKYDSAQIVAQAAGVAAAAGYPWGRAFRGITHVLATDGSFDGKTATACIEGVPYTLVPVAGPEVAELQQGNYVLVLSRGEEEVGLIALQPRIAPGVEEFVQTCRRSGVQPGIFASGDQIVTRAFSRRVAIPLIDRSDAVETIQAMQERGANVAFVSDNAGAASAFAACNLAIGIIEYRSPLPARADLLAPDFYAVATIIETAAQREAAVRDSVGLASTANIAGGVWGLIHRPSLELVAVLAYLPVFASLLDGWVRLRGGRRTGSHSIHLVDPHPERWGKRSIEHVLTVLNTSREGLSSALAAARSYVAVPKVWRNKLLMTIFDQLRSPLIGMLAAGAGISLLLGSGGDVVLIVGTVIATIAVNVWQEHKADRVVETLERLGTSSARVLRDGEQVVLSAHEVVPGDVLLLAPGDRVPADARLLETHGLEVDEAALTGESLPVAKAPHGGTDESRIILEGSDVTAGSGRAIIVAVGRQTRMGAIATSLARDDGEQSPLSVRLSRMLYKTFPLSIAGSVIVVGAGLIFRQPLTSLLALGVTMLLAAVPEGLPILARIGEAGVARRLASRKAVVRRLSSVEALGRVDVACADKTGTMTKGRLSLNLLTDGKKEVALPSETELAGEIRHVLLTAALASPHPEAQGALSHPTDKAVIRAAQEAELGTEMQANRGAELSFDPRRSFHATVAQGRLCVKGAPEVLLPRCDWVLQNGEKSLLDRVAQQELNAHSLELAGRGLRVLLVAEGPSDMNLVDPQGLTCLGFVGISDPLRPTVREAVERCRDAGVRVIMITGDHPVTARVIAREAGLIDDGDGIVLTGREVMELESADLDERLKRTAVVARATPLDKLRIIESLQRLGHTVAMTGDGVNDAPALRLADIGVAMGQSGTEVARQTADVVLTDDDFSTLVEALVEGRSFWRNIRRALGLLLGGNLGEISLVVGASVLGLSAPLTARQILAMNAITDILPALAVALQHPEHRNLAGLRREGASALGKPLQRDIWRRALTSSVPSLISYMIMLATSSLPQARAVAFGTIISTQLAQTLEAGRSEKGLTRSVFGAVTGSTGVLLASLLIPQLRNFLNLVTPSPLGWILIGSWALGSVFLNRLLGLVYPLSAPSTASVFPQASTLPS